MRACYLDASALVKLAILEDETAALQKQLAAYPQRATSIIAAVEVPRALARTGTEDAGSEAAFQAALEGMIIVDLDDRIASTAAALRPASLRSLDAIHLASALSIGDDLDAVVTYDRRLADAARAAGLTVIAPT